MQAIITAGGRVDGDLAAALGTPVKALARFGEETILERTVRAARGAGARSVLVVGGAEVEDAMAGIADGVVPESEDGGENVLRALDAWRTNEPLLYLTSDMPFVTAAALTDFIGRVPAATLAMAVAEDDAYDRHFPGAPAHGIVLAGERITNGGAFVLPAGIAGRVRDVAVRFFSARKSRIAMAALLGPALMLRFVTRRLRIEDVERKAAGLFGINARAVRGCAPELGFDIDTIDDYRYAVSR